MGCSGQSLTMSELLADIEVKRRPLTSFRNVHRMFAFAKRHAETLRGKEYHKCIDDLRNAHFGSISQHRFVREYLWCVYVSGFSAKTIAKKYDALLRAHNIEDTNGRYIKIEDGNILDPSNNPVLNIFNNLSKFNAVQKTRALILKDGWRTFSRKFVKGRNPQELDALPNIGPALACHLARNLGNLDVCKPDVHLKRLAAHFGYGSVESLCKDCSSPYSYSIGQTDLILWMASVDHGTA